MYQQNYNYQPQYGRTQVPVGLKGRPVASLEEARASSIDFDGSVFYFPDLANKRIYTKQINLDGTAKLLMYELSELPTDAPPSSFITREEFEATIAEFKKMLAQPKEEAKPEFNF